MRREPVLHIPFDAGPHPVFRSAQLRGLGWTKRQIAAAVRQGALQRARRGAYVPAGTPGDVVRAAAEGGRLACVSALAQLGVFVHSAERVHLHFDRGAWKHAPAQPKDVWHWQKLLRTPHPCASAVSVVDALAQALWCETPRNAVACIDSALHLGLIREDDLDEVFAVAPARRRILRALVNGRAESGTETIVRLIARQLGFRVEVQAWFSGVGRVDLLLDGWLVVECDSAGFHASWEAQRTDRRRDLALAARGLVCVRFIAQDILFHPERVVAALRGLRGVPRLGSR